MRIFYRRKEKKIIHNSNKKKLRVLCVFQLLLLLISVSTQNNHQPNSVITVSALPELTAGIASIDYKTTISVQVEKEKNDNEMVTASLLQSETVGKIGTEQVNTSIQELSVQENSPAIVSPQATAVIGNVAALTEPPVEENKHIVSGRGKITEMTNEEFDYLCHLVSAEAGSSSSKYESQRAVAEVVLNRVEWDCKDFPDDVISVINQHHNGIYQFSPVLDGHIYTSVISDSVISAVNDALASQIYNSNMVIFRSEFYFASWGTPYFNSGGLFFSTLTKK